MKWHSLRRLDRREKFPRIPGNLIGTVRTFFLHIPFHFSSPKSMNVLHKTVNSCCFCMRGRDRISMTPTKTRGWPIARKLAHYSVSDDNGCIVWQLTPTGAGYGQIWRDGRYVMVHRAALEQKLGRPIKKGLQACHSCHNRLCINPDHLREDTPKANIMDRVTSGRGAFGERVGGSRLKEAQVRSILDDPRSERALARLYSVSPNVIGEIKRGNIWKHITR